MQNGFPGFELDHASFMQVFHHKTKTIFGFFTQTLFSSKPMSQRFVSIMDFGIDSNLLSLNCLPCHAKIKAATKQGILLCVNENSTRRIQIPEYYVCKPSTEEWHHIPNPRARYFTEGIGMVALKSDPLCFKITLLVGLVSLVDASINRVFW
jgi:hypothetical protein